MSRQRTITLSDRPPVRIIENEWPTLAEAAWEGEGAARATLKVRRHADGRRLVYGVYRYGKVIARAGLLLDSAEADTVLTIREVTNLLAGHEALPGKRWQPPWRWFADDCIAALPVEVI